jgi:hypothetical protein
LKNKAGIQLIAGGSKRCGGIILGRHLVPKRFVEVNVMED